MAELKEMLDEVTTKSLRMVCNENDVAFKGGKLEIVAALKAAKVKDWHAQAKAMMSGKKSKSK